MMRARRVARVPVAPAVGLAAVAALAAACGMAADSDDPRQDGGVGCELQLDLAPRSPVIGASVRATASVTGGVGITSVDWTIGRPSPPGGDASYTELTGDGTQVEFVVDAAGEWSIRASGDVEGQLCFRAQTFNVAPAGPQAARYRLRLTPGAGETVPPQDGSLFELPGGAPSWTLGQVQLDEGTTVRGAIAGPSGALAAYLRLTPLEGGTPTELFASAAGAYEALVAEGVFDLLVVPYGDDVAPWLARTQTVLQLGQGYTLSAGDALTGRVLDPEGLPVEGAIVAVATGTLPAQLVSSGADGTFAARVRAAEGALALTVLPPPGAAWPALELGAAEGLAVVDGSDLEIGWSAATAVVNLSATATDAVGAPLPGARVTFVAEEGAAAGALSLDGGPARPVTAAARVSVTAGAAGAIGPVSLPAGVYGVVVEPPAGVVGQAIAVTTLDLTVGPPGVPPVFATAAAVPHAVTVAAAADATPIAGARVVAVARGVFGGAGAGGAVSATTDAAGEAELLLSPAVPHDLVVIPPLGASVARAWAGVAAGAAATSIALPPAARVSGTVVFRSGAGAAGVHLAAFCADGCPAGWTPSQPVDETAAGAGGAFELRLPDPAVP